MGIAWDFIEIIDNLMSTHIIDLQFLVDQAIAAYVIETTDGLLLVETGPHSTFQHLETGLQQLGYSSSDIRHVLLTHIHFDHAGAAWAFAESGAKVYVHPVGYKHMADPSRLYQSAKRIYGDQMESLWGEMKGIPNEQLIAVDHGQSLTFGNTQIQAWHTPGHASHHIAWQLGEAIFTGDVGGVCISGGPVVAPCPPPDIDIEAWKQSIELIRSLHPTTLYLTHFGPIHEVDRHLDNLWDMLQDWAAWIKSRMDAGMNAEQITPLFQAYTDDQLRAKKVDEEGLRRYAAANPAWMSVAGLIRYWERK